MTEKEEDEMLEDILATPYAEVFRQFVKSEMELQPHESVLSIGCGPGFETAVLAEDISEQGLSSALISTRRCWTALNVGVPDFRRCPSNLETLLTFLCLTTATT